MANRDIPKNLAENIKVQESLLARKQRNINQLNASIVKINHQFNADAEQLDVLLKRKQLQQGNLTLTHLNESLLTGEWRNRENLWLDWQLNKDGTFSSTYQALGSRERTENSGLWALNGKSLVFIVDSRQVTDARGVVSSKRLVEETRTEILEADKRQLMVIIDGEPVTLIRP